MKNLSKITIYVLITAIIIVLGIILYLKFYQEQIYFTLNGEKEISIYEGETYKEPGFNAKDKNGNNINDRVIIESDLNNDIVGKYIIKYSIKTKLKTIMLERTINVLKDPLKNIEFVLKGNKVINIELNEEFFDPLYTCIDNETNRDLTSLIKVDNLPNNQQIGTYEVKYTLKIDTKEKILTRTVNVLEKMYDVIINNTNPTNQNVTILFSSNIPNFSYIVTPDNKTIKEKTYNYEVNENGQYKFIVYDDENSFKEYIIPINNIDKQAPIISSCSSVIDNKGTTTFTINTTSDDIAKYTVNNSEINMSNYTINQKIENATVTAYDKANNTTTFNCSSYYKPITPKGNEKIIRNVNTDTLKVWMEQVERSGRTSFYVTHIWAQNAYSQMQVSVPNDYGRKLRVAKRILDETVTNNNWQNKLIVAINASGFVQNPVHGQRYYNANSNWNYTSFAPIVMTNGKLLRDFSSGKIPAQPYNLYGLDRNSNLVYYEYAAATNSDRNKAISQKVKTDGVLNTFSYSPVLVYNYAKKNTETSRNIRQGLCQLDKNNFVFITDVYTSPRTGFSYSELADYMISLGCKNGFNLDGGGSNSLIFKDKNKDSVVITGNTRDIADILLFHE